MEPPSGRAFLAALEGGLQVPVPVIASQHQSKPEEHLVLVARRRIEILETRSVWRDAKLALTQHAKAAEGCNSVQM
jgi:hypothetical protein